MKNIQLKTVIIFTILGIVSIVGLGAYFLVNIQDTYNVINNAPNMPIQEVLDILSNMNDRGTVIAVYALVAFLIIAIGIVVYIITKVTMPLNRLIDSAKKVATGEETKLEDKKNAKEVDEIANAIGMMTSELQENLKEVSRQKNQIETILLHMTDGIIAFNMEGKIILVNPAGTRLLRIMPEDDTFQKIFERLNMDINMEKIIYLDDWTSTEERVSLGDKHINLFFAPLKDEYDRPAGVMVVIQDITEHVNLDNMRKEFVADVSHELKTPITSIMGYADTLLEGEYDKQTQDKFLGVIASEARRMAKLVTDLLTLSRFDNNQVLQEKETFDLGELVKQCQEKLQPQINQKKHQVECFVTANVPPVYADKDGIQRVVLNILTNSIKYTKEKGHIKIYVGFVYNDAYIKVIDNGLGIPEGDLTKIFERFYRVDKARTREMGGTGLGLSIAKEILDKNDGSIDIKSEQGKGTEVVIRIPTKQEKNRI